MSNLDINLQAINKALEKGFKDSVYQYGAEVTKVISNPRFWAGFGDVRDIVDTAQLRTSQEIEFITPFDAEIRYTAEHAVIVHNGSTRVTLAGKVVRIAPRPFMRIAAEEMGLKSAMAKNIKYRISRIK